jgi:hypothetical protein
VYAALRETQPVRRMPGGSYFLTRYADVVAVHRDARRFLQRFPGYRLTEPPVRCGRVRFRGFLRAPFSV